jgi:SAM-dependent methyltransferase
MDNSKNIRNAYEHIYSKEGIKHKDPFYSWIIGLLQPENNRVLIDIACGQGRLAVLAQERGLHAFGSDFSITGLKLGQTESLHVNWVVGDGECLPLRENCADYVTHIGSLEHYFNPNQGAREIFRLLKPGGKACILLPNAFGLLGNILHVHKTGDIFDDGQPLQRYGTRKYWEGLLVTQGLKVEKVLGYNEVLFPRTFNDFLNLIKRPKKLLRLFIVQFIPINLTNHLIYLCTRD